jgi:hypothetical protein
MTSKRGVGLEERGWKIEEGEFKILNAKFKVMPPQNGPNGRLRDAQTLPAVWPSLGLAPQ